MATRIVVYYHGDKDIEQQQIITISGYIDYAHFKAVFDTLLERHYDFRLERAEVDD